jgi:hypothetical protein
MTKWRGEQPDKTSANKTTPATPGQERNTMLLPVRVAEVGDFMNCL